MTIRSRVSTPPDIALTPCREGKIDPAIADWQIDSSGSIGKNAEWKIWKA